MRRFADRHMLLCAGFTATMLAACGDLPQSSQDARATGAEPTTAEERFSTPASRIENESQRITARVSTNDRDGAARQWFAEVTAHSGIDMRFETGATGERMTPEIAAGGVAVFDADGDGRPDIYILNGNRRLPDTSAVTDPARDEPTNRFFRNLGDFRFIDDTLASGLGCHGYGFGVAIGDIDNDGNLDVFISNLGPDRLFRNRGDGTFEEISREAGVGDPGWGTSCVFLDIDRSGFLDLYVTRYVVFSAKKCRDQSGRPEFCGPREYPPVHDLLYRNNGNLTFTDITASAGLTAVRAAGLGVVADDFDDDGWIDIYVANDAYANNLWINRRNGTFTDMAMRLGCALNMLGEAEAGMGVVAADFNNDTRVDLFMTHLMNETNTLYINHGGRRGFTDVTSETGLGGSSLPYTGFGVAAFDADHDGFLDIFVGNGRVYFDKPIDRTKMPPPWNAYAEPNLFYRGRDGRRFDVLTEEVADLRAPIELTRGAVAADLNGNGRLDLITVNTEAPVRIFRNDAGHAGNWLMIRAVDPQLNRDAVGARVMVATGSVVRTRTITSATSYLSAAPLTAHFGLGASPDYDRITVRWPNGETEVFPGGPSDRRIDIVRGEGSPLKDGAD